MLQTSSTSIDNGVGGIDGLSMAKREIYNLESHNYDAKRFRSPAGLFYEDLANTQLYRLLGDECGSLLDVATGTGRIAVGLAQRGLDVTAIDISEGMLRRARNKALQAGVRPIRFLLGDAASLPFRDNSFDAVVSFRFLHIMPPSQQAPFVAEMVRVLKPGGALVVEFNNALPFIVRNLLQRDPNVVIWPWEAHRSLRGGLVVDMIGIGLPGIGRLSRYSDSLSRGLGMALQRGPTAYLARQLAVKAIKGRGGVHQSL
jgi:SAM-dependent methyltransferase